MTSPAAVAMPTSHSWHDACHIAVCDVALLGLVKHKQYATSAGLQQTGIQYELDWDILLATIFQGLKAQSVKLLP